MGVRAGDSVCPVTHFRLLRYYSQPAGYETGFSCLHGKIRSHIRAGLRKLSLHRMRNSGAERQESPQGGNSECCGGL